MGDRGGKRNPAGCRSCKRGGAIAASEGWGLARRRPLFLLLGPRLLLVLVEGKQQAGAEAEEGAKSASSPGDNRGAAGEQIAKGWVRLWDESALPACLPGGLGVGGRVAVGLLSAFGLARLV